LQAGPCSQMPPGAATCRYSRDIRGIDLAGSGRRNDQDLADARYCRSAAEPRSAGPVRIARIHPCQATPDEIRGNLGIHRHGRANAGCSPQMPPGSWRRQPTPSNGNVGIRQTCRQEPPRGHAPRRAASMRVLAMSSPSSRHLA